MNNMKGNTEQQQQQQQQQSLPSGDAQTFAGP